MAPSHNAYLAYKRDTNLLLYWVIRTSNDIINSQAHHEISVKVNTSGQTTVSGLLAMANLIAANVTGSLIPAAVYRLFQSVVRARTTSWQAFQQIKSDNPDPDIEKSNASHKFFIDALRQAFEVLGGKQWESSQDGQRLETGDDAEDEIKQALFSNKFSKLDVSEEQIESEGEDPASLSTQPALNQQRRKAGKSKKTKGKKKTKKQPRAASNAPDLEDVPLKDYRIIDDESGNFTDYLMAVYALVHEWNDLRRCLSRLWVDVAYAGLNSATAGAVSNIAVAMLKRSEFAVFLEFSGHDSYETVMKTVMRGDPNRKDLIFTLATVMSRPGGERTRSAAVHVDMKELLLIHAYQDFMAFVTDFQKDSNGKPSKAMAKQLGKWDPQFDLQKATKEERVKWRRTYTINWLYDLVNLFSYVVVQRNTIHGENLDLSKVDWSVTGPWNEHRRLFGLNEFAGFVCSMAWQKPGTDISKHVMPHHILQLQLIVDSLTVSRGWSISTMEGHVIRKPAQHFRPRRDLDRFLDRESKVASSGYLRAVDFLKQVLQKAAKNGDPFKCEAHAITIELQSQDFDDWLGESQYMSGFATIPPSRFSDSNTNGLWEYSPFLCGVGLMEGLEIAYRLGMFLWDDIPEPVMAIHLHNMLVKKGYIAEPVGLYKILQNKFQEAFFSRGAVPDSNFAAALMARITRRNGPLTNRRRLAQRQEIAQSTSSDIHTVLDVRYNVFFTLKPNLILYREANWNTERVPERDITIGSLLGVMRLSQTKQFVDPETGKRHFEPTELVRRYLDARTGGNPVNDEDSLLKVVDNWREATKNLGERRELPKNKSHDFAQRLSSGYFIASELISLNQITGGGTPLEMRGIRLLDVIKMDIHEDIAGNNTMSSLNYPWVTLGFMMLFARIEQELKERRNPVYVKAFETKPARRCPPRVDLVCMAMLEEDDECLRVMAREFENPRSGCTHIVYWDVAKDLSEYEDAESREAPEPGCTIM